MSRISRIGAADLLKLHPDEVYVRSEVPEDAGDESGWAWSSSHAYAFAAKWKGGAGWLTVGGRLDDAVRLFEAALEELPTQPPGFTLPRGGDRQLPASIRTEWIDHWDFRWTYEPPPPTTYEDQVSFDDAAGDDEITAFLDAASPSYSARPGDPKIGRWVTMRDGAGALLAVGADTRRRTGVAHLASIATRPDARGRGLGAAVTAALTRRILDEGDDIVTLGMYAGNDVAGRLYTRLGYAPGVSYTSGRFAD